LVVPRVIIDSCKSFDKNNLFIYDDLAGMVRRIKKAADLPGCRYIYVYWLELDKICHKKGCQMIPPRCRRRVFGSRYLQKGDTVAN